MPCWSHNGVGVGSRAAPPAPNCELPRSALLKPLSPAAHPESQDDQDPPNREGIEGDQRHQCQCACAGARAITPKSTVASPRTNSARQLFSKLSANAILVSIVKLCAKKALAC